MSYLLLSVSAAHVQERKSSRCLKISAWIYSWWAWVNQHQSCEATETVRCEPDTDSSDGFGEGRSRPRIPRYIHFCRRILRNSHTASSILACFLHATASPTAVMRRGRCLYKCICCSHRMVCACTIFWLITSKVPMWSFGFVCVHGPVTCAVDSFFLTIFE